MASQLQIVNLALIRLGEGRITSLSDNAQASEMVTDIWEQVRDDELRRRAWRFATVRASLAADVATPEWGFSYQYTLPGDCVRVLQISEYYPGVELSDYRNGDTAEYRVEGDKILSRSSGELKIKYTTNAKDIGLWDPCFADVFSWRIAKEMCERFTESTSKWEKADAGYTMSLREARRANALEAPPDPLPDDTWIMSRL